MTFRISNIYKSLVRQVVEDIARASSISPDLKYYAWDTRDDEAELETVDLCGLSGWTFKEDRGLWQIHCGITLSTVNDENLMREIELVDLLHDSWGEQNVIPLRDDNGVEVSQLMVQEFELLVAGTSEKRNYRPLGMTLQRTSSD